tara:strand:+ start:1872 stop:2573 length:702 start_codon:yes stop_codon:yes gene_type:complete
MANLTPLAANSNGNYATPCSSVNVAGLVRVQIAYPLWGSLYELGIATDSIEISERAFYHDVPGDRNGGPQGPPVEVQKLGEVHTISMRLSTWNKAEMQQLEEWYHDEDADADPAGGADGENRNETLSPYGTRGTMAQWDVGEVLLARRGFRLCLETSDLNDTRNYWCCIMREPKTFAIGTKFTEQSLTFEAHRYPKVSAVGEAATPTQGKEHLADILYDRCVVNYAASTYASM